MGMQAFKVTDIDMGRGIMPPECCLDPARRIFHEHLVLAVERGKSLLVSTLDGCLYRRGQRLFNAIDQGKQPEVRRIRSDSHLDPGLAALTMRRGEGALLAQPCRNRVGFQPALPGKRIQKPLFDQLPRQRC